MRKIISLLCICISLSVNAQGNITFPNSSGLTENEFKKAVNDYLEMTLTETYLANKASQIVFSEKMGATDVPLELAEEESWQVWITENLAKTNFKSVEEAIKYRSEGLNLATKLANENKELYDMIKRATSQQRKVILEPEHIKLPN